MKPSADENLLVVMMNPWHDTFDQGSSCATHKPKPTI